MLKQDFSVQHRSEEKLMRLQDYASYFTQEGRSVNEILDGFCSAYYVLFDVVVDKIRSSVQVQ